MKQFCQLLGVLFFAFFFTFCEESTVASSQNGYLTFTEDTIAFDTIFTSIGSTTQNFKVINSTSSDIMIDRIELAKGEQSGFRINVDGATGIEFYDVVVPSHDSLYIFVDVNLEENGANNPMLVNDSIVFYTINKTYDVDLLAWGQDFVMVKDAVIQDETWTSEKPYLVYNYAFVDSAKTLTIEEGTQIYFHNDAGLFVEGSLKVEGTEEFPVYFTGERNDELYYNVPDQWDGIVFYSGSKENEINHARIRNANIGLKVGTREHSGSAELTIRNSIVENMAWAGIWATKAKINATNCQFTNVRYYNVALLLGGEYNFTHSTIANYYLNLSEGIRTTESLIISNYLIDDDSDTKLVGNLEEANFVNCIISGDRINELKLLSDSKGKMNYLFDHSLLTVSDTTNISDEEHFNIVYRDNEDLFINPYNGDFALDTLSKAIDFGDSNVLDSIATDLLGVSRDKYPDLGCYEFVPKIEEE